MNGKAVASCLLPAFKADGAEIPDRRREWPKGDNFIPFNRPSGKKGLSNAGVATPGMLFRAKALLDENPESQVEEIKTAHFRELCRCTGYTKIVRAISEGSREDDQQKREDLVMIGQSVPRIDGLGKLTGKAVYAGDVSFPGYVVP